MNPRRETAERIQLREPPGETLIKSAVLKGTGFSPYVKPQNDPASAPEGMRYQEGGLIQRFPSKSTLPSAPAHDCRHESGWWRSAFPLQTPGRDATWHRRGAARICPRSCPA